MNLRQKFLSVADAFTDAHDSGKVYFPSGTYYFYPTSLDDLVVKIVNRWSIPTEEVK